MSYCPLCETILKLWAHVANCRGTTNTAKPTNSWTSSSVVYEFQCQFVKLDCVWNYVQCTMYIYWAHELRQDWQDWQLYEGVREQEHYLAFEGFVGADGTVIITMRLRNDDHMCMITLITSDSLNMEWVKKYSVLFVNGRVCRHLYNPLLWW